LLEVVSLESSESSTDDEVGIERDQDDDLSVTDPLENEHIDDYIKRWVFRDSWRRGVGINYYPVTCLNRWRRAVDL
jgi:hypothetical protein